MLLRDNTPLQKANTRVSRRDAEKTKRRTPRACDRCRLKKAKCDGRAFCKTCKISDSVCTYAVRRGREARNYYSRMRDITDEALQILYRACKADSSFPGRLPEQDEDGIVSTNAILEGLGLVGATVDEHGLPQKLLQKPSNEDHPSLTPRYFNSRSTPSGNFDSQSNGDSSSDTSTSLPEESNSKTPATFTTTTMNPIMTDHDRSSQYRTGIFAQQMFLDPISYPMEFPAISDVTPSFFELDGFFNVQDPFALTQEAEAVRGH